MFKELMMRWAAWNYMYSRAASVTAKSRSFVGLVDPNNSTMSAAPPSGMYKIFISSFQASRQRTPFWFHCCSQCLQSMPSFHCLPFHAFSLNIRKLITIIFLFLSIPNHFPFTSSSDILNYPFITQFHLRDPCRVLTITTNHQIFPIVRFCREGAPMGALTPIPWSEPRTLSLQFRGFVSFFRWSVPGTIGYYYTYSTFSVHFSYHAN